MDYPGIYGYCGDLVVGTVKQDTIHVKRYTICIVLRVSCIDHYIMYLKWKEKVITDSSDQNITRLYNEGYLFGRVEKGEMYQTRSVRIDLGKFELSSENRRILKKTETLELRVEPLPYSDYHWSIGKLGKDFYDTKFGNGTFSANKIKELLTEPAKSSFNRLLVYSLDGISTGYCIAFENETLLHYCYPFYQGTRSNPPAGEQGALVNVGLGMMLKAIVVAKKKGKKYMYLGSASRPTDTYKLQFAGLEWFDGTGWKKNIDELKKTLTLK